MSPLVNDVRHIALPPPTRTFETLITRLFRDRPAFVHVPAVTDTSGPGAGRGCAKAANALVPSLTIPAGSLDRRNGPLLEVIDKGSATDSHPVSLLFVHGTWHAAWCWDEHFLDFFADKGYRAVALSLRGHGASSLSKPLKSCSIGDYVDDVHAVVGKLGSPPVLIGHSVGGFIVQKYLESHDDPAGVLLASTPPRGGRAGTLRALKRHPWLMVKASMTGDSLVPLRSPQLIREAFFSAGTSDADVVHCASLLGPESVRLGLDVLTQKIRTERINTPLLVLGAACDNTTMVAEVEATARAYHTPAEVFPDMGHDMMLEPGWQAVAERIDGWLSGQGL